MHHDETTADGTISLEHVECIAACDYAPVVMVNWEFYDHRRRERPRAGRGAAPRREAAARPAAPRSPTSGASSASRDARPGAAVHGRGMSPARRAPRRARDRGAARPSPATLAGLELAPAPGDAAPAYPDEER